MPSPSRIIRLLPALASAAALAAPVILFRSPATTLRDAGSIGRLAYDLAWWTGPEGADARSTASALGFEPGPGAVWEAAGPSGEYDLFPFTLGVIPFPEDSSVLVLVTARTRTGLDDGDGATTLVAQSGRHAVLAVGRSVGSYASEASLLVGIR